MSQLPTLFCPYFEAKTCRSCSLLPATYPQSLQQKMNSLRALFPQIQKIEGVPSPKFEGFRNKAKMVVTGNLEHWIIGLTEDAKTGREILHCPLHLPRINELLVFIQREAPLYKIAPYSVSERKGEIKYLLVFQSESTQEMYLRFVVRSRESFERLKKFSLQIQAQFKEVKVISMNLHPEHKATIEGEEEIFLTSSQFIQDQLGPYRFAVGPRSFVQTNHQVAQLLYQQIACEVQKIKPASLVDLYCGLGLTTLYSQSFAQNIIGIEINPEAVALAQQKVQELALSHCHFECRSADDVGDLLGAKVSAVIANPPRSGLSSKVRNAIRFSGAQHFIYSSCSSISLKRDVDDLADVFEVEKLIAFDMFPFTSHLEILALLRRKSPL